jgi:hypothetical protein
MTPDHRIGPEGREDDVTRGLRRIYAAPADESYWRALQARIVAAVASEAIARAGSGWWLPLARWARAGAAAAAVLLAAAGAALWRAHEVRDRSAFEIVVFQRNAPRAQLAAAAGPTPNSDAVLRDVLSP